MSTATPHKTALHRRSLSRPVALALEDSLLSTKTTFFEYGCRRPGDLKRLHQVGVSVYQGCGRQPAGSTHGVTLVKLGRRRSKPPYPVYPDFDPVGHPAPPNVYVIDLPRLTLDRRDYRRTLNPPILRRTELLLAENHRPWVFSNRGVPLVPVIAVHELHGARGLSILGHQAVAPRD